jgi:Tol biopolymer transport system component
VAFSPDGGWIAIDGDAGTIVYDIAKGTSRFVGGGNPVWSPKGGQLAVVDPATDMPASLRIVDPATGTTSISHPFQAIGGLAWSPNGRWIAASGGSGAKSLIRINVATGEVVDLDGPSGHLDAPRQVAWSPDSRRIAFVRWDLEDRPGCPGMCSTDVFVADADGANPVRLNRLQGKADQPSWSPDGRWIAYRGVAWGAEHNGNEISVTPTTAGIVITRPDGTGELALAADAVQGFAWWPDSDHVHYAHDEGRGKQPTLWETSIAGVQRELGVVLDAGTTPFGQTGLGADWQAVALTGVVPALPSMVPPAPAATPEVRTPVAAEPADPSATWPFLASDSMEGCQPVLVATSDGAETAVGDPCDLSQGHAEAVWSPTASAVCILVEGHLSILHRDGHIDRLAGDLSGLSSLSWSPKGTWLNVLGVQNSILRVDGFGLRALPGTPYWSPDEHELAVGRPDGTLLVGAGDGSGLRPIGSFPAYVSWSSDGSRFAFVRDGDAWIAAADGSVVRNVTAFPLGGATGATWSHDDEWIAVSTTHGMWVMRSDGTDRRLLDLGLTTFSYSASWSPASNDLAVDTYTNTLSGQTGTIFLVHADGSATIRIDSATRSSWSPDGRFLAVVEVVAGNGGFDFGNDELLRADGSGLHRLSSKAGSNIPVWVPAE